jgi:hypothetical protein
MNPLQIITEFLQSIPPRVRKIILLVFALAVVIVQILSLFDTGLDFGKINAVLAIIGGYLGFQSAANVPPKGMEIQDGEIVDPTPVEGRHRAP